MDHKCKLLTDKDIKRMTDAKCGVTHSSSQLRNKSKSFLSIKTIDDLKILYPNRTIYSIKYEKDFAHYFVNHKKVFTRALIV